MRNQDLILAAHECRVVTRFRDTIGLPGRIAVRLQPNHPTDDRQASRRPSSTACCYGCGDAVIGINPAGDNTATIRDLLDMLDEIIRRYEIPTQSCVLTHVTTTIQAIERGRAGRSRVPVDRRDGSGQSVFGVTLPAEEGRAAALSLKRGTLGDNVMYFETGQGSALSADAHHGVDQQTSRPAPTPSRARSSRCWSTRSSASSAPSISTTASRSSAPASRITSAASCSACRWAATSATRTTPKPIRTTWTAADAAGRGGRHLHHGRARRRRHHAELPVHLLPRRALRARAAGPAPAPEFEAWLARAGLADAQGSLLAEAAHALLQHSGAGPGRARMRLGRPPRLTPARIALGRAGSASRSGRCWASPGPRPGPRRGDDADRGGRDMKAVDELGLKTVRTRAPRRTGRRICAGRTSAGGCPGNPPAPRGRRGGPAPIAIVVADGRLRGRRCQRAGS